MGKLRMLTGGLLILLLIHLPSLALAESREESLERAKQLNQQVQQLYQQGRYADAISLAKKALAIFERALGPNHPNVATSLNNLAMLLKATGDYAGAMPLYERALKIRERVLGSDHPDVAQSLNNLAVLLDETGDYAGAKPLYERALKIDEQAFGPMHQAVATSLNNLAALLQTTGDYAGAKPLVERALRIREQALGPNHPDVAQSLNNLATLHQVMGDYAEAMPLFEQALRIREQALGPNHPDVAQSLNNLAMLLATTGDYAGAKPLYERALKIDEQAFGPMHQAVAASLNNLAFLNATRGQSQAALAGFVKGLAIQDRLLHTVFGMTTERQKLAFLESITGAYEGCLSLIQQQLQADRQAVRAGLELVLRRKGVLFDAQSREQEALAGRLPAAARQDWQRVATLRTEYARLVLNKPAQMTPEVYQEKLASLQREIEAVEKRLAEANALVAQGLTQRTITIQAAAKALPKDAALAEFVRIRDFDFPKGQWAKTARYLAFILTPSGEVTLVDLGDAAALEAKVSAVLTAFKHIEEGLELETGKLDRAALSRSQAALAELSRSLWAPLQPALGKTTQVLLSPDGLLNLVPFAALPDAQGRLLVAQYRLAYVTSGRELVTTDSGIKPDSDLVLVADPAYDRTPVVTSAPAVAAASVEPTRRSRNFQARFNPLPGTAEEARAIAPLVQAPPTRKHILLGAQATETAVKTSRSPRILHLATHGFFLQDQPMAGGQAFRGVQIEAGASGLPPAAARIENPLIRSGLAFAGANHAAEATGDDDGILTALEITGMDLHGTDLVVLSACETGLGEVKNGEGVYGLRRAFALAGAKNLLMSLWPVNDAVAATQMTAFYTNLRTLPPAEALRQAQLATIKELTAKDPALATPVLWAPFFLQGAQALGK